MKDAKSAIVFAVPLNQDLINPFLSKENFDLNKSKIRTTTYTGGLALELSCFLDQLGYDAILITPNYEYRKDTPNGILDRIPLISHKYWAAVPGIAFFGFSGHILTKNDGAVVVLATVVTNIDLVPTDALQDENNYCDKCKLCQSSCISNYISDKEVDVKIGKHNFKFKDNRFPMRCSIVLVVLLAFISQVNFLLGLL